MSHCICSYVSAVDYVYVCVCVCQGGVYFNIVSQESISSGFIPSLPLIFLPTPCLVTLSDPLSTGEQQSDGDAALYSLNMVLLCVTCQCLAMSLMLATSMASIAPEGPQILARRQTYNSVNFVCLIKPPFFPLN